jgi:hypothetical protein
MTRYFHIPGGETDKWNKRVHGKELSFDEQDGTDKFAVEVEIGSTFTRFCANYASKSDLIVVVPQALSEDQILATLKAMDAILKSLGV